MPQANAAAAVPSLQPKGNLHVEGKNDEKAIGALLEVAGSPQHPKTGPVVIKPESEDDHVEGVQGVLRAMDVRLPTASHDGPILGFVLDMDDDFGGRWDAVRHRLHQAGVTDVPEQPPADGYIGVHPETLARVGVWLMPDNQQRPHGTLEHFLEALIPEEDVLLAHAREATNHAKDRLNAQFPEIHRPKAVMHTWLAWQKTCGLPYGTAIASHFLHHEADIAQRFVAWFRSLFEIT